MVLLPGNAGGRVIGRGARLRSCRPPFCAQRLMSFDTGRTDGGKNSKMERSIEELLSSPYWIVDILPSQVPKDSPGRYFAVEAYYRKGERFDTIMQKHIDLILKLYCYRDIYLEGETAAPSPEHIASEMRKRYLYIRTGDSMILSEPDDTHMTVFAPDPELLALVRQLAQGEGMYVWQPSFE